MYFTYRYLKQGSSTADAACDRLPFVALPNSAEAGLNFRRSEIEPRRRERHLSAKSSQAAPYRPRVPAFAGRGPARCGVLADLCCFRTPRGAWPSSFYTALASFALGQVGRAIKLYSIHEAETTRPTQLIAET